MLVTQTPSNDSSRAASTRCPAVKWAQNASQVFATVDFAVDRTPDFPKRVGVTIRPSGVSVSYPSSPSSHDTSGATTIDYLLEVTFPHAVEVETSSWTVKADTTSVELVFAKTEPSIWWMRFCNDRLATLSVDWGLWIDEPDEKTANAANEKSATDQRDGGDQVHQKVPFHRMDFSGISEDSLCDEEVKQMLVDHIPFDAADGTPLDDAPDMLAAGWIEYFLEKMTTPQRMLTLVEIWNACEVEERKGLMRSMVGLASADLSDLVKGGGGVLRNLAPERYLAEGVVSCHAWVRQAESLDQETRGQCLSTLFAKLSDFDRRLVMSTFM